MRAIALLLRIHYIMIARSSSSSSGGGPTLRADRTRKPTVADAAAAETETAARGVVVEDTEHSSSSAAFVEAEGGEGATAPGKRSAGIAQEEDHAVARLSESMESGSGEKDGEVGTPSPSAPRKPLSFKAAARVATVRFC